MTRSARIPSVLLTACLAVAPALAGAQERQAPNTLGAAASAEAAAPQPWTPPTGPPPRLTNGHVDFSGVWNHPYVPDMSATNKRNPALQSGPAMLPYTAAGLKNIQEYDPAKNGDYTGMCMPFGFMRSINAPYPIQIMQSDQYVAFLFEQNSWFHVAPFKDRHSEDPNPTWFGESIAKWDGDTLVVDTVGFNGWTRLDTKGDPHSDKLHLVQRFTRTDAGHLHYVVTIDDPVNYTKPWTNERTFTLMNSGLLEYSCEENNRSLWEGRIKLWIPPTDEPLRNQAIGEKPAK